MELLICNFPKNFKKLMSKKKKALQITKQREITKRYFYCLEASPNKILNYKRLH